MMTASSPRRVASLRWSWAEGVSAPSFVVDFDPQTWLVDGRATLVKHGADRTVYRIETSTGVYFWKVCRVRGVRGFFRRCFRPAKAKMEFDRTLRLRELGIPTVRVLGWAASPNPFGESVLLTEELANANHPAELWDAEGVNASERRKWAVRLAEFLAKLHSAGVEHRDLHPGNLLYREDSGLHLLDVHDLVFGASFDIKQTLEHLAIFGRFFALKTSRCERFRFWRTYWLARGVSIDRNAATKMEAAVEASNRRLWTSRIGRCLRTTKEFDCIRTADWNCHYRRELPEMLVAQVSGFGCQVSGASPSVDLVKPAALATGLDFSGATPQPTGSNEKPKSNPAAHAAGLTKTENQTKANPAARAAGSTPTPLVLKDSRSGTVAKIVWNGQAYFWKRFKVRSRWATLLNRLRYSPAMRSWIHGNTFLDRAIPTATPLLVMESPRTGEAFFLCEWLDNARSLTDVIAELGDDRPAVLAKRIWIDRVAVAVAELHRRGVSQRDMKPANLLVVEERVVFIDLVGVRTYRRVPDGRRLQNVMRLNAGFLNGSNITRTDRLRFLKKWLHGLGQDENDWRGIWRKLAKWTEIKRRENERRGRILG